MSDEHRIGNQMVAYKDKWKKDAEKFKKKRMTMIMLAKSKSLTSVLDKIQKDKDETEKSI